jgi:ABC-2 type transport system ATP-binding protein
MVANVRRSYVYERSGPSPMDAIPVSSPKGSAPADNVILRTVGLTKRYGQRLAVNQLNLDIHRGDVFGLLGPNGSGKTTTLRMALGLVWPTSGDIEIFGGSITNTEHHRLALQRIGAIVEQPAFYPFLTGPENLRGVATFAGMADSAATRARIDEVLTLVGLAERRRDSYKKYSLGMKQRLGIAAALLTNPELVILDEPTNGLDPAGMVEVRALISRLAQEGITVLLSSHLLHEVQQVCTRVGILKEGSLLAQGEVNSLLATEGGLVLGFADAQMLPRAAEVLHTAGQDGSAPWIHGVHYVPPEPGGWMPPGGWLLAVDAPVERAADANALLAGQGIYAAELRRREASLEQYFLALTGGTATAARAEAPVSAPQGGTK